MRIDSHHHFWQYDAAEYPWIGPSMDRLRRNFLPEDLAAASAGSAVDAVISVQARQTVAETEWLISLAETNEPVCGVVGWAPLADPTVDMLLERWTHSPWLKSIRHVVQDEPDAFLHCGDFNRGVETLHLYNLAYDLLVYARQLPEAIEFVDRHPDQRIILDHIAKPTIHPMEFDEKWEQDLRELAKRDNVACKFSGVVTEVRGESWTTELLRPYWDVAWEAFGPRRLMFGTDWPVCLLRSDYGQWVEVCEGFTAPLSESEQKAFWGQTAIDWYRLSGLPSRLNIR